MRLAFLAFFALCASTVSAHADSIANYNLKALLSNGTSAGGYVSFDETTGLFSGGSIYASLGGANYVFNTFGGSAVYDSVTYANFYDATSDIFQLIIPGNKDVNYVGGNICSSGSFTGCAVTGGGGSVYVTSSSLANGTNAYATAGSLTATPEPSSLLLLGTGVMGMVATISKRLV